MGYYEDTMKWEIKIKRLAEERQMKDRLRQTEMVLDRAVMVLQASKRHFECMRDDANLIIEALEGALEEYDRVMARLEDEEETQ